MAEAGHVQEQGGHSSRTARFVVGPRLSVSLVTYAPDLLVVAATIDSLVAAVRYAQSSGVIADATLALVDNGPGSDWAERLTSFAQDVESNAAFCYVRVLTGHGNLGYGRGHNLAVAASRGEFHLVLNPDVLMNEDSLHEAIGFLQGHPQVGMVVPAVFDEQGSRQFLCKRYPTLLDLALRGIAPRPVQRMFSSRLARYEMRDAIGGEVREDIEIASGCFMLFRRTCFDRIEGFSPAYFMYFEDFDLSIRLRRYAKIAYVPAVRIVHFGGHAARKGMRHVQMFAASAIRFFGSHGWKLL